MTDERSEGRGATPETPQTGAGDVDPRNASPRSPPGAVRAARRGRLGSGRRSPSSRAWPTSCSWRLVIYLTYFFTMFFSTRPPAPAPVPESARVAAKKIEELRAEDRKLLTTYGPAQPRDQGGADPHRSGDGAGGRRGRAARSRRRPLPDSRPAPPAATPKAGRRPPPKADDGRQRPRRPATRLPPPSPRRARGPADAGRDGAGAVVPGDLHSRATTWTGGARSSARPCRRFPDLTDPSGKPPGPTPSCSIRSWTGKGQFMLPMKDKFALAHTDAERDGRLHAIVPAGASGRRRRIDDSPLRRAGRDPRPRRPIGPRPRPSRGPSVPPGDSAVPAATPAP